MPASVRPFMKPVGAARHQKPSRVRIRSTPMVRSTRSRFSNRAVAASMLSISSPAAALALYYAFREPQGLIKAGGIAQALMLPFIAGATIYLRRRDADPRVGPSLLSDLLTWVAFLAISAVAIYSTFNQLKDLLMRT